MGSLRIHPSQTLTYFSSPLRRVRVQGPAQQTCRNMSTSNPTTITTTTAANATGKEEQMEGKEKTEWLIILPDHEGALEKRMSVRP